MSEMTIFLDAQFAELKDAAKKMTVEELRDEFSSAAMAIVTVACMLPDVETQNKTPFGAAKEIITEIKKMRGLIAELEEKRTGDTLLLDYIESDCAHPAIKTDGTAGRAFIVAGDEKYSLRELVKMLMADSVEQNKVVVS